MYLSTSLGSYNPLPGLLTGLWRGDLSSLLHLQLPCLLRFQTPRECHVAERPAEGADSLELQKAGSPEVRRCPQSPELGDEGERGFSAEQCFGRVPGYLSNLVNRILCTQSLSHCPSLLCSIDPSLLSQLCPVLFAPNPKSVLTPSCSTERVRPADKLQDGGMLS